MAIISSARLRIADQKQVKDSAERLESMGVISGEDLTYFRTHDVTREDVQRLGDRINGAIDKVDETLRNTPVRKGDDQGSVQQAILSPLLELKTIASCFQAGLADANDRGSLRTAIDGHIARLDEAIAQKTRKLQNASAWGALNNMAVGEWER